MFFKNSIVAVVALLAATSCGNESFDTVANHVNQNSAEQLASVTVKVTDFSVTQEDIDAPLQSRAAQSVADYDGVKVLTLAFYAADGTETYKKTQRRSNLEEGETFGSFNLSLPMGSYTMVVLAHGLGSASDDVLTLTSPTEAAFTTDFNRETFATTQSVTINSTDAVDISATLNRIVSKLQVVSSDGCTAKAKKVRVSFGAGSTSFSPTTGLALNNDGYSCTIAHGKEVGFVSRTIAYIFLSSDEQDVDVTIETLDADDNVLFRKVVQNVPLKRNRQTNLTGAMYTNRSISGSFQVNTDWITEYDTNF